VGGATVRLMGRRREDCTTCTAFDDQPPAGALDVDFDAYWQSLPRWKRATFTAQGVLEDAAFRLPGIRSVTEWLALRRTPCPDCGVIRHEVFMLHDDVWASLGLAHDAGWFCLPCVEKRLGCRVVEADLCDVPANDWL
jgi:hypothetical protein